MFNDFLIGLDVIQMRCSRRVVTLCSAVARVVVKFERRWSYDMRITGGQIVYNYLIDDLLPP